jgi:nickel-type superoxide dismutase maturation protease
MRASNGKELILWLIRRRRRFRVTGASMQPLLNAEDEILVDLRAYRRALPRSGDLVVARHPTRTGLQIVKRIREIRSDGTFLLEGDNPDPNQTSSSLVSAGLILGRVTSRFASAT